MAESMSDTFSAGSDDATTLYCQPCGNVLADAFCRDCSEYLCSACSSVHEKLGITKNHALLKGAAMPTSFHGKGKPGLHAGSFQKCPKHPEKKLKFFCQMHETVCCMACSVVDHKQCNTAYIPDLAKNYMTGPEYRQLIDEIKETEQLAAKRLIDIEKKMKAVQKIEVDELAMLDKYRTEIIEFVDKRVKDLSSQIKKQRTKDIALLQQQQSKSQKIESSLSSAKTKLKACEQRPSELFTESKQTLAKVAKLKTELADIADKSVYQQYRIRKDADMEAVLNNKEGVATMELVAVPLTPGCLSRERDLRVTSGEELIVTQDIAVVSSSRVLVTDGVNHTVRLLDSQGDKIVSKLPLSSRPQRVCLLRDRRAAVTLPDQKRIQFIRVDGDTLSLDGSIDVKGTVIGIARHTNHLILSYQDPGRLEKITMNGGVTHQLNYHTAGRELFKCPFFITTSHDGNIFIADSRTNIISQLDQNLQVVQTFTSPMLTKPAGIVTVSNTQLLVAGSDSKNILELDTTTGSMTPLLGKAKGIQVPWALDWCPVSRKLYVGFGGYKTTINVYSSK